MYTGSDPVEKTPEYKRIKKELEEKIEKELEESGYSGMFLGKCHIYWGVKKRILKDDYNIEWHSPAELNPHICYD